MAHTKRYDAIQGSYKMFVGSYPDIPTTPQRPTNMIGYLRAIASGLRQLSEKQREGFFMVEGNWLRDELNRIGMATKQE
jgi:hypothetical protein